MISGSGAAAAVSVLEDRFKPDMEVRKLSSHWPVPSLPLPFKLLASQLASLCRLMYFILGKWKFKVAE